MKRKIALLMALICALSLFGGCADKGKGDTESTVSLEPISVPKNISVTNANDSEEWVYEYDGFKDQPHHVPQFNVNADGVAEINKKIVEKCKGYIDSGKVRNISYTFMMKNCLLSVCIEFMDDGWFKEAFVYNLSLGDGTLVEDARTMAAYCGITDEEYRIAAATAVTIEYKSLFASFSDSNGTQYKENLLKNQSKKMTDKYEGYINERGELSFCGQMYSLDGSMRGFSCTSVQGQGMVLQ